MARRMVERGVRFVQIYHNNWDTHSNVKGRLPSQCKDVDQACYGLIQDLKQRGLLVIWGGRQAAPFSHQGRPDHDSHYATRPSSPLLHHVAGRRRLPARHRLWRDR